MARSKIKKFALRIQVEIPKRSIDGEMWVIHEMDVSTLFGQWQYQGVTLERTVHKKHGEIWSYKAFKIKDIPEGATVHHWNEIGHRFHRRAAW